MQSTMESMGSGPIASGGLTSAGLEKCYELSKSVGEAACAGARPCEFLNLSDRRPGAGICPNWEARKANGAPGQEPRFIGVGKSVRFSQ